MATRAVTFTAKIRNLKDYHSRMINNATPLPSGVDIANTLKHFSQTLLSVLKDVPIIPSESYGPRQRDSVRLSVFPNLNYSGLYEAVMNIIDVVTVVQHGQHALGESILTVLGCLVPFLEYDLLDTLPYVVATTLALFPTSLQKESVQLLCTNLLPMTLGYTGMNEDPTYATESTSAIMMMIFQYVERGEYHSQLIECIMSMKKNACKDLLSIIAYGPPQAKPPAVNHLFHYWPQLNLALTDRRGIHYKYLAWEQTLCQRDNCSNTGNATAVKMCLDPAIAIECGDRPPPLYLCTDCVLQVRRDHAQYLMDILQPFEHVSLTCENKNCTSSNKIAICTCFSMECASLNGFRPTRYCETCHNLKHSEDAGADHIFHLTIPDIWSCDAELQSYLVEAIVSLLKEAQPLEEKRTVEMGEERLRHLQHFEEDEDLENIDSDERKLLSRYGIWLMVELCKPKEDLPIEILGRLIAMLFQWFDATAYLPDDNVGNALERLKPEYICKWLQEVRKTHFEVILSCLLPHPVEYARVGGHWDTLSSRTSQIKEGLNRMCCLVPYDIVTYQVWDYVMPFWLEAIRTEVPEDERQELKVLLCKVFDTDMSPLPFSTEMMYHFFVERFENTSAPVQEQNLQWLQILTSLEILIPLPLLLGMFKTGVSSLTKPRDEDNPAKKLQSTVPPDVPSDEVRPASPLTPSEPVTPSFTSSDPSQKEDSVANITCFIMMIDLILRQIELQESTAHLGVYNDTCKDLMVLMYQVLTIPWEGTHTCTDEDDVTDCGFCDVRALWHQLAVQVVQFVAPRDEIKLPVKGLPKVNDTKFRVLTGEIKTELNIKTDGEKEEKEPVYNVESFPAHLKLLYSLLQALEHETDSDALFYLLKSMKLLCLHSECLNYSVNEHESFVKFCLKELMIPNLWKLLQGEHSQIACMSTPLLLHCLTLPSGSDIFWQLVQNDFVNDDWMSRFSAVEKVTVLARMINPESVQNNQPIMTSLAHAFCYLIGSLSDINSAVVQKTTIYMQTIKESAVDCIRQCLEFQFDSVINDRRMILQKLYLLSVLLKDNDIFTWEFFLNRFDTLCLEAQLDLESTGDISCLTDLHSTDKQSDHFLRKINRARFALARTDSIRSVTGSMMGKVPYRRAASVPMHLLTRTLPPNKGLPTETGLTIPKWKTLVFKSGLELADQSEKDKPYTRQQSAPHFGRSRGSRFGLGLFGNYMFPGGQLREFTDEQSNFAALLQRAMDLEGVDRETLHQLVGLLMKFMVQSDQDKVSEDRNMNRAQNTVLRHLNILLGYNQSDKAFSVPPYKLRYSAVFSGFLSGLPEWLLNMVANESSQPMVPLPPWSATTDFTPDISVLDKNFQLGNIILPVSMALLQYAPSPQRYASDYQPPNYTLGFLEPITRQSWLTSLLVILYKYQYNTSPASVILQTLVRITINTIDAALHRCKRHDELFGPASPIVPRTRDTSNVSVGDLENILETDTPPQSPGSSHALDVETAPVETVATPGQYRKNDSINTDETDLESLSPNSKLPSPQFRVYSTDSPPRPLSPTAEDPDPRLDSSSPPTYPRSVFMLGSPTDPNAPIKLRTFEQSVEQFMMEQVSRRPPSTSPIPDDVIGEQTSRAALSPVQSPCKEVDRKIVEQILQFESENESRKVNGQPETKPAEVKSNSGLLSADKTFPGGLGFERKFQPMTSVIEEVKEPDEDWDASPRKSPLVKTKSAGQRVVQPEAEFIGLNSKKSRAQSNKDVSAMSKLEKPDLEAVESELEESPCPSPSPEPKFRPNYRQRKARKTGLTTIELQKIIPELADLGGMSDSKSPPLRKPRRSELMKQGQATSQKKNFQSLRFNEQTLVERCSQCHAVLEQYDEDTVSLAIVCLATFIHREPALAAPLLLDMLQTVARIAASNPYPWQAEISGLIIPGNSVSVARQFLRCSLHQLAPNGVFPQLFQTELDDPEFLKTIAAALLDFNDLNCNTALQLLLEGINELKTVTAEQMQRVVGNLATYMEYIALETNSPAWSNILLQFDVFFRRLPSCLPNPCDMSPVLNIMISVLKIPGIPSVKGILEPFSKLLAFAIQNCSFKLQQLLDICSLCGRAFSKERDKLLLTRSIVFELVQALKFKSSLPDENFLLLVQFVCLDAGGTIGLVNVVPDLANYTYNPYTQSLISSNAADCMKQHLNECVEFIVDLHTINKVKNNLKGGPQSLNEDTLGGQLKAGMAQFVALEFTRGNGRGNRAVSRYLPWLYHPPSTMQQGPREFIDCVGHIRLLSWLLLGSLTHTAVTKGAAPIICQPLPLETSTYIADHIMVIVTGFAEQSKASVLHMSSLFHAFILCQLWTMYCESFAALTETCGLADVTIMDFWARVTPGILQLLSHSKVLAEMVNLHFLSLLEALQECNSTVLSKLFPMWTPILYSYHSQLPGHMQVRLQMCQNWQPKEVKVDTSQLDADTLQVWLKRLQFKLGQIEVQSSAATQFYTV